MVDAKLFLSVFKRKGFDFFVGVPDSLLKDFCACLQDLLPRDRNVIAANEGNAVGLACGWHLSTSGSAVVYMQNSGEGNAVNPLLSLADQKVYSIPMLLLIGWRGAPGIHDEPQHAKQGEVTLRLLEVMDIPYRVLDDDWHSQMGEMIAEMKKGQRPVALVVPKGFFEPYEGPSRESSCISLTRELMVEAIVGEIATNDLLISTTGKESRELFEVRESRGDGHENDFLTVGGMGHTSSIALGVALGSDRNVWCLDGDGSMIMHMGALAVIGQLAPPNFKYVLNDNGSHDSVGGQPTASSAIDVPVLLRSFGFETVVVADNVQDIRRGVEVLRRAGLAAMIVKTRPGSRADLGRPTSSPQENKCAFMRNVCFGR